MAILFTATHPDEVHSLILLNTFARLTQTADYTIGTSLEFEDRVLRELRHGWGRGSLLETVGPTVAGDVRFREWWARYQRLGSSPGTVIEFRRLLEDLDVRDVLAAIQIPTLIVHRAENWLVPVALGRYLSDHLPNAKYLEVPGIDYFPFIGEVDPILDAIEEFLTGSRQEAPHHRVLTTVLFTDIVDSTGRAAALGDRGWRDVLDRHNTIVRRELERFRGRVVDTAGDGFLATFDGPARAIRCAQAVHAAVRDLGLEIRAGLHTGEIELVGDDVRGIAVHIGARVSALAGAGEVLVSSTVRDLVAGSGIEFQDRGTHQLKGVPGEWRLFAVKA